MVKGPILLSLIPVILAALLLGSFAPGGSQVRAETGPGDARDDLFPYEAPTAFDPFLLNIRMSRVPLHPPTEMIKQAWVVDGYHLGRLPPDAPRAAVIDNDQRQRLLILSATDDGGLRLYRVGDLPLQVGTRLTAALINAQTRDCRHQRMDPAGELGCLALSLLEALQE